MPTAHTRTTTSTTSATTTTPTQQHDQNTTHKPQNDHHSSTTRTTRTKITEPYTPRHHDLLVILPDPAGSVGCVLCAITLHADDAVIDCGRGPQHRSCADDVDELVATAHSC